MGIEEPALVSGEGPADLRLGRGLTFLVWLAIVVYVGNRYGDGEWYEEMNAFRHTR